MRFVRFAQTISRKAPAAFAATVVLLAGSVSLAASPSDNLGSALARASGRSSTTLSDGRILDIGSAASANARIFDPATGKMSLTGALSAARLDHSALLLADGRVLVAGGIGSDGAPLQTAEIFNPATLAFERIPSAMRAPRIHPVLFQLPDGKVQVIGGDEEFTMEMYNTAGNYFTARVHLKPHIAAGAQTSLVGGATPAAASLTDKVLLDACGATVTTDKTDYQPGDTVIISGQGWQAGDTVSLLIHPDPQTHPDIPLTAFVASDGSFLNSDYVVQDSDLGVSFLLTASSSDGSCVATTAFTDAAPVRIYTAGISPTTAVSGTATLYTVTITNCGSAACGGPSDQVLGSAIITLPASYSAISTGTLTASAGKVWTAAVSGNKVTITSNSNGNRLAAGELVTVQITATSCTTGANAWSTDADQSTNADPVTIPPGIFVLNGSDPSVNVTGVSCASNKLAFTTAALNVEACSCAGPVTVQIQDSGGIGTNPATNTTVNLTTTSSGTFYSDNLCASPVTSVVILTTENSESFYYKDNAAGSPKITAADNAAVLTSVQQTETITADATKPVIDTCAADQDVTADASCAGTVPDLTPQIVAHDNCTASGSLTITQSPLAGTALVLDTPTVVTITVKDAALNAQTCTATVTLKDKTKPVIDTCASDQDVSADASCQGTIPDLTPQIAAHDNCTAFASLSITQSPTAGTKLGTGPHVVTITVEDLSGNKQTCTATVTIKDATKPVIDTCAPNQDVTADASCAGTVPDLTGQVTAHDNCTAAGSLSITQSPAAGTAMNTLNSPVTVTITVEDLSGNKQTCTADVTLKDKTKPTINCHGDVDVYADPGTCQKSVTLTGHATASDNCDPSPGIGYSLGATHTYSIGSTQVTATATDASGNFQTCNFNVIVHATPTATVVTQPTTTQYSDQVTLTATVTNTITSAAVPVGSVSFDIGGSTVGSVSVNASGVASITVTLVEPNAAQADLSPLSPGTHTVTATYSGDAGACYAGSQGTKTLTITKEDATLLYLGDTFVSTSGNSANVNLAAQVTQAADGFPGDITNAWVTFNLYASSNVSMLVPDLTFGAQADSTGLAQTTALVGIDTWTVIVVFDDTKSFYDGPDAVPAFLTVFQPTTGSFVTGGGWVYDTASVSTVSAIGGTLRGIANSGKSAPTAAPNSHGNFGFTVKLLKSGTLQGQSLYLFRGTDGYNYIVKSTNWQGGGLAFNGNKASFGGKCSVKIVNPKTGKSVGGFANGRFRVDVTDNGSPGVNDAYAISVYDPSNVLYHQSGTPANQNPLQGGNVVIHAQ